MPTITIDLYGNVFRDGENTGMQIGDFARNFPELAPQVDGALRDAVLAARLRIAADVRAAQEDCAAQIAVRDAEIAALRAELSARLS